MATSEEILTVINEIFISEDDKKLLDKATEQGVLNETLEKILKNPRYKRQSARVVANKLAREMKKILNEEKKQEYLDGLDTVEGYYVGGNDWKNSKNPDLPPDKQTMPILTSDGFMELGVFGHSPSKEFNLEAMTKYNFSFSTYTQETTSRVFLTAKKAEKIEGGSEDEFFKWLTPHIVNPYDLVPEDQYKYFAVEGQIRRVDPLPVYDIDESIPAKQKYDSKGKKVMKDGEPVLIFTSKVTGNQDLVQPTLDESDDELFTAKLSMFVDNEGYDEHNQLAISFYNQRLGRTFNFIETFNLKENFDDICSMDGKDAAEFLTDLLASKNVLIIIKMGRVGESINQETTIKTNWFNATGLLALDMDEALAKSIKKKVE